MSSSDTPLTLDHPAVRKFAHWRWHPDGAIDFVREVFGVEPDEWQKKFLRALVSKEVKEQRIALLACAGPGKSACIAWAGWWFMLLAGDGVEHPKGAVVSCTADNLRDNLWAEFAKWRDRSKLLSALFEWTKERIFSKQHPETWFISARTFSRKANPEELGRTLSGLHSAYVFVGVDESGDIPIQILRTAEQAMSNCKFGKIIQAGNPISHEGMLYKAAVEQRSEWTVIEITGDPDRADRSPRVDIEWAKRQIKLYGRDNPWVMAYILGQFPPSSINQLLSVEEVREAMRRNPPPQNWTWAQKRVGVDPARFGNDRTCIIKRQGVMSWRAEAFREQDTMMIADRVLMIRKEWQTELETIDDTGHWGHGVYDKCRQLSARTGCTTLAVLFHGKPRDSRYGTKRDELWFEMADWVKQGGALADDDEMVPELTTATYTFVNGKIKVEDKDQIKERLGRSPDKADALVTTFAVPDMPSQFDQAGRQIVKPLAERGTVPIHQYEPYGPNAS